MSMSRPPGLYDLPESLVLAPFMSPLKHKMMEASLNMSATDSAVAHMRDSVAAFFDAVMLKEQPHNREPVFNAIAALQASSCDKTAVLVAQYLVLKTMDIFQLELALAMLNPVVCSKLHALFGSSVHGAGFEQHEAFVRRWMPVAPSDVLDKIATGSMPAPKGVDEAAWISFLEQGFTPALRQAELDGEVHSMRRLVSVCFEAAMETLSAKDQSRVRGAFAELHASSIDDITVLTAEAALCRAMGRIYVDSALITLKPRVVHTLGTLVGEPAGSLQAVKRHGALLQHFCETSPAQLTQELCLALLHTRDGVEEVARTEPREDGAPTALCEEPEAAKGTTILHPQSFQAAGPSNQTPGWGVRQRPFLGGSAGGFDPWQRMSDLNGSNLQVAQSLLGWMRQAGPAFRLRDPKQWPLLHALAQQHEKAAIEPVADSQSMPDLDPSNFQWSSGCQPVIVDGKLAAATLRFPEISFGGIGTSRVSQPCDLAPFKEPLWIPAAPLGFGEFCEASAGQTPITELHTWTFLLTPQIANFLVKAIYGLDGRNSGVFLAGHRDVGISSSLRALESLVCIAGHGDVLYLDDASVLAPTADKEELRRALLQGTLTFSCGPGLTSLRVHSLLKNIAEGKDTEASLSDLLEWYCAPDEPHHGGQPPPPRMLILDNANKLHAEYLRHGQKSADRRWRTVEKLLSWTGRPNKVLAYGEDFRSFRIPGTEGRGPFFDFNSPGTLPDSVCELTPLPVEMAVQLMSGQRQSGGASAYACHVDDATADSAGAGNPFLLPGPVRQLLDSSSDALFSLKHFAHELGATPSVMLTVVKAFANVARLTPEQFGQKLVDVKDRWMREKAKWWERHIREWINEDESRTDAERTATLRAIQQAARAHLSTGKSENVHASNHLSDEAPDGADRGR